MKKLLFLLPLSAFAADLPPPAARPVDFTKDIQPLFEAACVKCHAKGKDKGGFSLETREAFLKGGDTGAGAVVGDSAKGEVLRLLMTDDEDEQMPKKGTKWTAEQVGLLRAWINQGAKWPEGVNFAKPQPENLHPRKVTLAAGQGSPVDLLLAPYYKAHAFKAPATVGDGAFARRAYLDAVGLLPSADQLAGFEKDPSPDKRIKLVRTLLANDRGYAEHWLTFWNDLLRNDYKGTGFIDGGRKQISGWLYTALYQNKPYDAFVRELVAPTPASEGFTKGILWRGNVNASMIPPMQAAQSVSQVFMGINLKCASCHDSFINDWALADCYGLAAVYTDEKLELTQCDKPLGKQAPVRFLYPEIGEIPANLDKPGRQRQLAELLTSEKNGRLARTVVNRLWARLMGRGLVEPLDDMDKPAWSPDVLDWLAEDLVQNRWNLRRTIELIMSSDAYALPAVEGPSDEKAAYVFNGPITRRLSAEQFIDAVSSLSGEWARLPSSLEFDFGTSGVTLPQWVWTNEAIDLGVQRPARVAAEARIKAAADKLKKARAAAEALVAKDAAADAAAKEATEKPAPPKDVAAKDAADKAVGAAEAEQKAAEAQLAQVEQIHAVGDPGAWIVRPGGERHGVVFRKRFTLSAVPTEAYATILASQGFDISVNGKDAKAIMSDGFRNGRVKLFDITRLLVAGENLVSISVQSHTDKGMNDTERGKFPQSTNHLNRTPGVAFYTRIEMAGGKDVVQIASDATWRTRRSPEGDWRSPAFAETEWAAVTPAVPAVDEGPGLEPIKRKDFANIAVELAPALLPAVSTAAHAGEMRASMLAADPLQTALDRPNREIITPSRPITATTIQALELTNGITLDGRLKRAADKLTAKAAAGTDAWLDELYRSMLSRSPTAVEKQIALELLGTNPKSDAIADLLWAVVNLPEFQLLN